MNNIKTIDTNSVLLLPGIQEAPEGYPAFGYICRAALAYLCTFSFIIFIGDALGMGDYTFPTLLYGLLFTIIFAVMGISKYFLLGGGVVFATIAGFFIAGLKDPLATLLFSGLSLWNQYFRRLGEIGYHAMASNTVSMSGSLTKIGLDEKTCLGYAYMLIALLFSVIFCASILKRVRVFPIILVGGVVSTVMLYYGMNDSNLGFAMMIACLCGVMAMSGYDRIYQNKKRLKASINGVEGTKLYRTELKNAKRQGSAMGGFTGLGVAALAMLILLFPMGIKSKMENINAISTPALKMENFVIAMVNGKNPDLGSLLFSGISSIDSRSTAADRPRYTGEKIFRVDIDSNVPVYLRNWVALDYIADSWHSASYDTIDDYKDLFGDGFTPELLTRELLWAIDPKLVELGDYTVRGHTELGFVTAKLDITKLRPSANLVFMPSYTDMRKGLLDFQTDTPSRTQYNNYYDGIFSSTGYLFMDEYSVVANLPYLRDRDFAENLYYKVRDLVVNEFPIIAQLRHQLQQNVSEELLQQSFGNTRDKNSLSYRFVYEMSREERTRVYGVMDNIERYKEYVYTKYLTGCEGFEQFADLAHRIAFVKANGIYDIEFDYFISARHEDSYAVRDQIVMKIIEYLSQNMTYTLAPKAPSEDREYINAAETFLFDTKEGYCVHFATSAVMLLRSLGIPARYAEGYIVDNFVRNRPNAVTQVEEEDENRMRYSATVIDSNAHAWIEVYFDGYGWVQYEATTPFMSDMYEGPTQNSTVTTERPDTGPEIIPPILPEETPVLTPVEKPFELPGWVKALFAITIIVTAAVFIFRFRAALAEKKHGELLASMKECNDKKSRLSYAGRLDEKIYKLLKLFGLSPELGEQLPDFAKRVDTLLGTVTTPSFATVSRAMLVGEFATDISESELAMIAHHCDALRKYALRAGIFTRFWRKYMLAI